MISKRNILVLLCAASQQLQSGAAFLHSGHPSATVVPTPGFLTDGLVRIRGGDQGHTTTTTVASMLGNHRSDVKVGAGRRVHKRQRAELTTEDRSTGLFERKVNLQSSWSPISASTVVATPALPHSSPSSSSLRILPNNRVTSFSKELAWNSVLAFAATLCFPKLNFSPVILMIAITLMKRQSVRLTRTHSW